MDIQKCNICPHNCGIDRKIFANGFCRSSIKAKISSVCIHKGEEPVISGKNGIINIFFAHCNLQCIYCQNYEISRNNNDDFEEIDNILIAEKIISLLNESENIVGFVSPSHFVHNVVEIINCIRQKNKNPIFVYNSNGYDSVESIKELDGKIDVYLPDFKYSNNNLALKLSNIKNYTETTLNAIKEMYNQKGSSLFINPKTGIAESGLIIRHLLLPGFLQQSKDVLKIIAEEISTSINISLMSQYFPPKKILTYKTLNQNITQNEYNELIDYYYKLGFYKGWIQELSSKDCYRPNIANNIIDF